MVGEKKSENLDKPKPKKGEKVFIPFWLRIFNVLSGILYIMLALGILYNLSLGEILLIYLLAFILFLMGIVKFMNAVNQRLFNKKLMWGSFFLGICFIGIAFFTFISPSIGEIVLIYAISAGVLLQGIYRIFYAIFNKKINAWATLLNIILGIVMLVLTVVIFVVPGLIETTLILLLSIAFILNGLGRIFVGIKGYFKKE